MSVKTAFWLIGGLLWAAGAWTLIHFAGWGTFAAIILIFWGENTLRLWKEWK